MNCNTDQANYIYEQVEEDTQDDRIQKKQKITQDYPIFRKLHLILADTRNEVRQYLICTRKLHMKTAEMF